MRIIENQTFDMERALYGSEGVLVKSCSFDGPADGESAFKECSDIAAENCFFNLRYPFWHDHGLKISGSEMTELCRASLWYSDYIEALMECKYNGRLEGYMTEVADATKEEAQECHDSTVEYYAYQLMSYTDVGFDYLADETIEKYIEVARTIMAKSKFTVNEGAQVGDDYQVKVDIQPLDINDLIHDDVAAYIDEYNAMIDGKDTSAYTDEQWDELEEQYAAGVLAIIESHISEIGYKDTVSKVVIIEFDEEGRYGISENDWYDIDDYIVDMK